MRFNVVRVLVLKHPAEEEEIQRRSSACSQTPQQRRKRFNVVRVLVLNNPPCHAGYHERDDKAGAKQAPRLAEGSLRTKTRNEIKRARMTYLQDDCSYGHADSVRRFTSGRVLFLNDPPARRSLRHVAACRSVFSHMAPRAPVSVGIPRGPVSISIPGLSPNSIPPRSGTGSGSPLAVYKLLVSRGLDPEPGAYTRSLFSSM
jgi:hypothetical protein